MLALQSVLNLNLVKVNMHKVFIVFIYTIPALIMFMAFDNVEYVPGLVLALGNAIGAWWSASLSIRKGDNFIKIFLIISLILMSLKMLDVF